MYLYRGIKTLKYNLEALHLDTDMQGNLLINLDKKRIIDPKTLTLSCESGLYYIAFVNPLYGYPFQYEVFKLLMKDWKGDRLTLVVDSREARDYLIQHKKYTYCNPSKHKLRRRAQQVYGTIKIDIHPMEAKRLQRRWSEFINQYVIINYDSKLYMTLDKRLLKLTQSQMPYFLLSQAEKKAESIGSWSGDRVGVELSDTATLNSVDYLEMFRMIGDRTACSLGREEMEHRLGLK